MTHIRIDNLTPRVQYTVGATPTSVFTVPFPFFANSDLVVYTSLGGTARTLTTDYTVTGAGLDSGGTVTLVAPVTSTTVTILRAITVRRVTDFPVAGPFVIDALNTDLDTQIAILQEIRLALARSMTLSDTDTAATLALPSASARANRTLVFDGSGNLAASPDTYPSSVAAAAASAAAAAASQAAASASQTAAASSQAVASAAATTATQLAAGHIFGLLVAGII